MRHASYSLRPTPMYHPGAAAECIISVFLGLHYLTSPLSLPLPLPLRLPLLQCISMLSWYCELDAWQAKLVRLGKKPDSVPHPTSGQYTTGKFEGDSLFNKLGSVLSSSAGTAAMSSAAGALGGKIPGFG